MTKPIKRAAMFDPEKYALSGMEESHSVSLMGWAAMPENRERWPDLKWLFHIPNGGHRSKSQGTRLRAMGVKRGVPDYCLPVRRDIFPGLWIELKRPKGNKGPKRKAEGKTFDEQDVWLAHLHSQGYGTMVCVGWEMARDTIINYLEYKG